MIAQVCAKEGTWRRSSRMEWVVNNPHTNAEKYFSSTVVKLQTDAHILAAASRLKCHPRPQSMNLSVPPKDESWVYVCVPWQRNFNLLTDNFRYTIKIQHQCTSQQCHINQCIQFYCTNQTHSIYLLSCIYFGVNWLPTDLIEPQRSICFK